MAASEIPADLELAPLTGEPQTASQWLSMFHLVLIALDPYTVESSALLPTATRVLENYKGADCRPAFLCTAATDDVRRYLGPIAGRLLAFADPDRVAVTALGLSELPALVHIRQDRSIDGVAEGWNPAEWQPILENLSHVMSWSEPLIGIPGDPPTFAGTRI